MKVGWLSELCRWVRGACIQCAHLSLASVETRGWEWCDWIWELWQQHVQLCNRVLDLLEPGDLKLGQVVIKRVAVVITVQPPRSTPSSSLVTLARPSTSSSLRITDRSFQYASPRLWNQLPAPLRQPRTNLSNSASPSSLSGTSSISSIDSPLSSSITPSLFHSRLKTFLFCKYFPQ